MKTMPAVSDEDLEYAPYDRPADHLTAKQAMSRYAKVRSEKPDALVILEDLDCGHWRVNQFETPPEKNAYLLSYLESFRNRLTETIRRSFGRER